MLVIQFKSKLTKTEMHPSFEKLMIGISRLIWSFSFLSWFFIYVFITNCGLNAYEYELETVLDILYKLINDSQNYCFELNQVSQVPKLALKVDVNLLSQHCKPD